MDLSEWLKDLGLGRYEATSREHEIEADVLPDLTEADLEKIGHPRLYRSAGLIGIRACDLVRVRVRSVNDVSEFVGSSTGQAVSGRTD